jgi:hypothetical protein
MSEDFGSGGASRPGLTGEPMTLGNPRVDEAIRRLQAVVAVAGYWTPLGKLVEGLVYASSDATYRQADEVARLLLGEGER